MLKQIIESASGKTKADVVIKNCSYVNVFDGTVKQGDIAITDGVICGVGSYEGKTEYDGTGKTVIPGLIDGHVHIESSQLSPEEFAALVIPHGTTTIIADPHEIVNVCGEDGLNYMLEAAKSVPLDVKYQLPSCVPATPFETSGAVIDGKAFSKLIGKPEINGCGEFMNVPGVVYCDPDCLEKIQSTHDANKIIDGHAPVTDGKTLNAYLSAGVSTDHECVNAEEFKNKLALGVRCHLRHGSTTKNLLENSKAINAANMRRALLCTDDRHAVDLRDKGGLDDALRTLVKGGFDPIWAVTIATLNNAECYGLNNRGAIAPGYAADLVVVDDLKNFNALLVFKDGALVAKDGKPLFKIKKHTSDKVTSTVKIKPVKADDFKIALKGKKAHVISVAPAGVVTIDSVKSFDSKDGDVVLDGTDTVKLAVVERHFASGNIGLGLLENYGLKNAAIAITVAHDSHNLMIAGDNNEYMARAAKAVEEIGGGMAVVTKSKTLTLPLDIAGLMSSLPANEYIALSEKIHEFAWSTGVRKDIDPFMTLAFLSLLVIPDIKLSDKGLFDVNKFAFIDINA